MNQANKIRPGALDCISDFEWLLQAYKNACKQKRYRRDVMQFTNMLEENLIDIQRQLRDGIWMPGGYRRMWVNVPKKRLIMVAPFRERVIHWSVYMILNPFFDKRFIEDSYACRTGKGMHKATDRLKYWLRQVNRRQKRYYYLKIDISKFFYRVNHDILLGILRRTIEDEALYRLLENMVRGNGQAYGLPAGKGPTEVPAKEWLQGVGMPIGSLLSQLFANLYLNELDQFAKHKLKIHYYIRYMDDIVILGESKGQLKVWMNELRQFLNQRLKLEINRKSCLRPVSMGVEFVGVIIWPTHTKIRKSTVRRIKRQTAAIAKQYKAGVIDEERVERFVQGLSGVLKQASHGALLWRLNQIWIKEMEPDVGKGSGNACRGHRDPGTDHTRASAASRKIRL